LTFIKGQTELCGGSHMSHPGDPTSSHCGTPLTSLEIKLIDVPEMNYFTNHFENEIYMPKGEVPIQFLCVKWVGLLSRKWSHERIF